MELLIRILAFAVVLGAAAAASAPQPSVKPVASHQSATMNNPVPPCWPEIPTCPKQ